MRAEVFRLELTKVLRQQPFEKLLIAFDSGDKVIIEHPENVAFDPNENGRMRFSVVTRDLFCYATFESVSSIVHQDIGTTVGA